MKQGEKKREKKGNKQKNKLLSDSCKVLFCSRSLQEKIAYWEYKLLYIKKARREREREKKNGNRYYSSRIIDIHI